MVVLSELAESLIADLRNHPAGRTARTILSGTVMRAVVIALKEGSELAEHDAPSAATLQVIRGKVTVATGEKDWTIYPGQLIPIPPRRHSVHAHADSAILLTVALG
jgi:quercetin dioxygenase-like cupin family protein